MDNVFKVMVNNKISDEKQNISSGKAEKPLIPKQPSKDTFEKETDKISSKNITNDRFSTGNENLVFKTVKLRFSSEDQEKMDKMNVQERIAYRRKLKSEGKYTVINSEETDTKTEH